MKIVELYGIFETAYEASWDKNPFTEVKFNAEFVDEENNIQRIDGFYDGEDTWRIRYMPQKEGLWHFVTHSNIHKLDGQRGSFLCAGHKDYNHGPVEVCGQFYFAHRDGMTHHSYGTTCYAWIYQSMQCQKQTLKTLESAPFNKLRMCVFPKWYEHNYDKNPYLFPYEGSVEKGFDYDRPNPKFFKLLDERVMQLAQMGIQADIILFHPYEREEWAFNWMTDAQDEIYLRYIISRLGAYHNVWWSLANEWDLFAYQPYSGEKQKKEYWNKLGNMVMKLDTYNHLRSIHNCMTIYDHSEDWITHVSIQRTDYYRTAENTDLWRQKWKKPVVIDECAYEGNIDHTWGNISGEELTRRFWEGTIRGGYVGHSETYMCPEDILWWSHGGMLKGSSPSRIAFLREILEEYPKYTLSLLSDFGDVLCGGVEKEYYLFYYSFFQPCAGHMRLPEEYEYHAEVIDTWNMTREFLPGSYSGDTIIQLPSKPYMLVRFVRKGGKT